LNGKRRKWFRGGPTRKDAERVLSEKLTEIHQGTYRETPKIAFQEFAELWIKNHGEAKLKPSTLSGYTAIIRKLLIPAWAGMPLSDISIGRMQSYVANRRKAVSAKTVCNEIAVIKEMFKHAHRWGYIKHNPSEHLERPRVQKTVIEVLSPEEVKKLLAHTGNHYRLAFLTDIMTGLRAGELWGLRWPDIDWASSQIFVQQSLWRGKFQTPKTSYSVRKVDVPDMLLHELRKWKEVCGNSDLVFPSPEGKPSCHNNVVKRYFNPALAKAGLRHVSFHSLRHTNASIRISVGQNIKYIQSQLGHASIKMTLDIYGHLFNDADFNRKQVRLLETSLGSADSSDVETPLLVAGSMPT
jgi:integrase